MLTLCPAQAQESAWAGSWQFKGSPVGNTGESGISSTTWEYIDFSVTQTADNELTCHSDNFYSRGSKPYPMDWKIIIEKEDGKTRVGWAFDKEKPASDVEFQEQGSAYAIGGKDAVEGEHRYIYLLTYNAEKGEEDGITIWSEWADDGNMVFTFPKSQQVDAVVSTSIPFSNLIGYIDSWANPSIQKKKSDDPTGISEIVGKETSVNSYFDLQGRRISGKPQKGIYIMNGRKYILR